MFPGVNPRQMQQMMKKMGIQQVDIPAVKVIIQTEDKEYVFDHPSVAKVNLMGQETYQIVGNAEERTLSTAPEISEDDIKTVMEQTGAGKEEAQKAIEEAKGDLAEAILKLQKTE